MTIRNEIKKLIQKAARIKEGIKIDYPADPKLGDYSTNIAFVLAKEAKKSPKDVANELVEKILSDKKAQKIFEKVEAAVAGFVNFTLAKEFLQKQLSNVGGRTSHINGRTSHINVGKGRKLNIEFLSANPTGKFQVGNGRIGFYGDALGNILKLAGYKVTKEYYINNAKSGNQIQELGKTALGRGNKYLTPYVEWKIKELKAKLNMLGSAAPTGVGARLAPSERDPDIFAEAGFLLAQEIQKDNKAFLEKIRINYDVWTREQEDLVDNGLIEKTLDLLKKKKLVYEQDGAIWLKTTKFGDDKDKVLVRSNGEYGYYLADIAYHKNKIKRGYKVIIDILGADHQGHVGPMEVAIKILGYKGKFDVLVSQLVQAKGGGKFSKRAGNVVLLEDLIDEVGVDMARYFYVMKSLDTQMEFDLDLAKDQSEKNPVYYIQYAHARISSILRNAREGKRAKGKSLTLDEKKSNFEEFAREEFARLTHPSELKLIKEIMKWPEVVEDTANDFQMQRVTGYANGLAAIFNQFYRDCKVISDDKGLTKMRLELVSITRKILREVLGVLGVSAPDRM